MKLYIVISLLSIIFSDPAYRPMKKQNMDFKVDFCRYDDKSENSDFTFVRPCKEGKHCLPTVSSDYDIYTCQDYTPLSKKKLGESCQSKYECDSNLDCLSVSSTEKECSIDKDSSSYEKQDPVSGITNYYCPSKYISKNQDCVANEYTFSDKCYFRNTTSFYSGFNPAYLKVCGKIILNEKKDSSDNIYYERDNVEQAYIGTYDDGTFVENEISCQSGFSIPYYANGKLVAPNSEYTHSRYNYCVTPIQVDSISSDDCIVKYSVKGEEKEIYHYTDSDCQYLMTKYDLFKKYTQSMEKCRDIINYDEPYTCGDPELRKYFYFYFHPDEYVLYKDETQVVEYLLQNAYPTYKASDAGLKGSNLNVKYFMLLLILLAL